jgi:xanthine dehydrogenase YagS FAD-binding subunit
MAGGTNLVDLMKEGVENPDLLVDVNRLEFGQIFETGDGVRLGALARNSVTANHSLVRQRYPLLTQAILAGASAQLRNAATNGGNLMQRTRCQYFYDLHQPCNKRAPGTGCGALDGSNRIHAIFGWSDQCIATYPGDMANALVALDASVRVRGANGERIIPMAEFHRLPENHPERDSNLEHGELITAIDLPAETVKFASRSYLFEDSGTRLLRFRARLGCRRFRHRRKRAHSRRPSCPGQRRAQALAQPWGGKATGRKSR